MKKIVFLLLSLLATNSVFSAVEDLYDIMPDLSTCKEGKLKSTETKKVLDYINKIRALHKLPAVTYNSANDVASQKTSLIMAANETLTHFPASSLSCYTDLGKAGAASSNLYISWRYGSGVESSESSVMSWMIDGNVPECGHRRWIINPWVNQISYGRVDGKSKQNPQFNVEAANLYYTSNANEDKSSLANDFVAYPYENYPKELIYDSENKMWYFSFTAIQNKTNLWQNGSVSFNGATIKIVDESNATLGVSGITTNMGGYGVPNCLMWNVTGLQLNKKYNVTISNVGTSNGTKTYNYWFKVIDGWPSSGPSAPILTTPTNNQNNVPMPVTLKWNAAANASSYEINVYDMSVQRQLVFSKSGIKTTSYTLTEPDILPQHKYAWTVKSYDASGNSGEWSSEFNFMTKEASAPNIPVAILPVDGAVNQDVKVKFVWKSATATIAEKNENSPQASIKYDIEVSKNSDFSDNLILERISDTTYTAAAGSLPFNTRLYWRIRAINYTTAGSWSNFKFFSTLDPSDVNTEVEFVDNSFYNYPNPFDGKTNIIFNSNLSIDANIEIFDINGNKILTVYNGKLNIGTNQFTIELESGAYYCKISSQKFSKTIKLISVK